MGKASLALKYLEDALENTKKRADVNQDVLDLRYSDLAEALNVLERYKDSLKVIQEGLKKLKGSKRKHLEDLRKKTLLLVNG